MKYPIFGSWPTSLHCIKDEIRGNPGNYRRVSLPSVLCKTLEKIIRENIIEHINNEGLLSENQHGFTSGRSCLANPLETFNPSVPVLIYSDMPENVQSFKRKREREREKIKEREKESEREREREWIDLMLYAKER